MLCVFCVDVFFLSLRSSVVDIVGVLVVAMIGPCGNHTLIVLLDSCTPTGVFRINSLELSWYGRAGLDPVGLGPVHVGPVGLGLVHPPWSESQ